MKKISITITEDEARLLRELIKHKKNVHLRNADKLERMSRYKLGGFMVGSRETDEQRSDRLQVLVNTHRGLANDFNIILENISGRMFQKGIKFDPINFLKTKILRQ